jgi:acyl-CoA synthetase (NDP forming)
VADCATKGVKAIHFFTSGFSETEDEDGERLESEVIRAAQQSGVRIIGPNCLGLYCPRTGLSFGRDFPRQSGPVGLVSQSGGLSTYCIREASSRGVHFSKVVSYGNASDLNETDFLEYLADDPETKIIAGYIEGVRNASGFIKALRKATKAKPVIILKVGATEGGRRAANSHTGSIAGSNRIWESALKQAGAIQVHDVDELLDVALLFLLIAPPKGTNTAVIGMGGGASVLSADDCSDAGLTLPMLPAQVRQRLKDICAVEAGRFFGNPVDINISTDSEMIEQAVETIAGCDEVDLLIIHMAFEAALMGTKDLFRPYIESVLRLGDVVSKPFAVVLHSFATAEAKQLASEAYTRLRDAGFPVYPSFRRAASAISRFIEYHQWYQTSRDYDS